MKLTINHLAPYLPYGLKYKLKGNFPIKEGVINIIENIAEVNCASLNRVLTWETCKPILRPLSDLTKEIEHNGERFVPVIELLKPGIQISDASKVKWIGKCIVWQGVPLLCLENLNLSLKQWQLLFSWHFDVFGLIEQNLAIDINTLK